MSTATETLDHGQGTGHEASDGGGHDGGHAAGSFESYRHGFMLAIVLTVIPFALVMGKVAPPSVLLPVILAIGALQMVVHLKYFLHLTGTPDGTWNMTALGLTVVIVAIVIAGSLWVMAELDHNMMPWMFEPHATTGAAASSGM